LSRAISCRHWNFGRQAPREVEDGLVRPSSVIFGVDACLEAFNCAAALAVLEAALANYLNQNKDGSR
jgi:hypothetical protein